MPLPSGTTISADDINSHLGRTAGTAVSWNTTVRSLSTGSPNLNGVRGISARHLAYTTNYATGDSPESYYADTEYYHQKSFKLPDSGYRVIVDLYKVVATPGASAFLAISINVVSTYNVIEKNYVMPFNASLPGGNINGSPMYLSGAFSTTMLSNGKLAIVAPTTTSYYGGGGGQYALMAILVSFNTDTGAITSVKYYRTDLGGNIPYNNLTVKAIPQLGAIGGMLSSVGNSLVTSVFVDSGTYPTMIVHMDCTNDNIALKYAIVGTNNMTSEANGFSMSAYSMPVPILNNDGSITVIRPAQASITGNINIMASRLTTSGTWSSFATNRHNPVSPNVNILTPSGAQYSYGWAVNTSIPTYVMADNKGYYYIVLGAHQELEGHQIQGSPNANSYFTGTITSMTFHKIRASDNVSICKFGISGEGPYYSYYESSKYGNQYYYVNYQTLSPYSIYAIDTDSSGNTYVVYKIYHSGNGGVRASSPSSISSGSISQPLVAMMTFGLSKFNSAGVHQWSKTIDIGPRITGLCPYTTGAYSADTAHVYGTEAFSILLLEDINIIQVAASAANRNTSTTAYYEVTGHRNVRQANFLMTTGEVSNNPGSSTSGTFSIYDDYSYSIPAVVYSAGSINMTYTRIHKESRSSDTSVASTTNFGSTPTWNSLTLTPLTVGTFDAQFVENLSPYNLGLTFNNYGNFA